MDHLRALVRDVPDFPFAGIVFRDITPLLRDARSFAEVVSRFEARFRDAAVDLVVGIESRGFLFGAPLALALGAGFAPVRKLGKLPGAAIRREYALEYGSNQLEMHCDAITAGQRVLLVDDVLATGGTARAGIEMIQELGGELVGAAFVIELTALRGRATLGVDEIFSLLHY